MITNLSYWLHWVIHWNMLQIQLKGELLYLIKTFNLFAKVLYLLLCYVRCICFFVSHFRYSYTGDIFNTIMVTSVYFLLHNIILIYFIMTKHLLEKEAGITIYFCLQLCSTLVEIVNLTKQNLVGGFWIAQKIYAFEICLSGWVFVSGQMISIIPHS